MVNSEMLEKKRVESGKTKTYLCKKLGIALQTYKRKCDNKSDFKLSEVDILCPELNIKTLTEREQIFFAK